MLLCPSGVSRLDPDEPGLAATPSTASPVPSGQPAEVAVLGVVDEEVDGGGEGDQEVAEAGHSTDPKREAQRLVLL